MLFNSFSFLLFFPLTVLLYFVTPHRFRWIVLFAMSCLFYMAFIPKYILILFVIIAIDYTAAIGMEHTSSRRVKRALLLLSLGGNIGILAGFKYYNWLLDSLITVVQPFGYTPPLGRLPWILPIGLSFHTFQSIAYTMEVYYGRFKAERHLGTFANYVLFFPQMVAGPIERPYNLLPQLKVEHRFCYANAVAGLQLMLLGFAKKCLVADNLAVYVDAAFLNPGRSTSAALALATIFFTFQIYCDFSGYSDIAIGSARVLGIDLMKNFDSPYLARSITEFWRRWHISLSTWFRDYVYIPLGGSRTTAFRNAVNLMAVFMVSGLWHGANWTFVVWGALHGFYMVCGRLMPDAWQRPFRRVPAVGWVWTLLLVSFAWIFFRASSLGYAVVTIRRIVDVGRWTMNDVVTQLTSPAVQLGWLLIASLLWFERYQSSLKVPFLELPRGVRWAVYYATILAIAVLGRFEGRQFIYFQF